MIKHELYKMHRIGSSFLVSKRDMPVRRPWGYGRRRSSVRGAMWEAQGAGSPVLITVEGFQRTKQHALPQCRLGEQTHPTDTHAHAHTPMHEGTVSMHPPVRLGWSWSVQELRLPAFWLTPHGSSQMTRSVSLKKKGGGILNGMHPSV